MASKGVNLLEGDDDEERDDDSGTSSDSGDGGGDYERRRGGFVDALMVILFVCVMLGGVAWAGYQFWWLPKVKKEAQIEQARLKQEQQRKTRLAKMGGASVRESQSPRANERFSRPAGSQAQKRTMGAPDRNMQSGRPAPSSPTETTAPSAAPTIRRNSTVPSPTGKAPSAAVAMANKTTPPNRAEKTPLAATPTIQKPVPSPGMTAKPRRETTPAAPKPEKKTSPERREPGKQLAGKKPAQIIRGDARKTPRSFYYSVQVASCSTQRCAESFSKRLKQKGFSAFKVAGTSRARRRSSRRMTEVRLGSFSSLAEARDLASRARKKKLEARVYRSANQWKVAVGSFRNLEDAALLLDRVEDSGFRGELASRPRRAVTRRLYRIRTGKFGSLREALAFRKKIRQDGFRDAIVVRRRVRK